MKNEKKENVVLSYISTFAFAIILALLIKTFIFSSNMVMGESMQPTLHQNDRLIAMILPLRFKDPERSDIVIIDAPDEKGKEYIKRLIGKPGDTVEIKGGEVYLNDSKLQESYIDSGVYTEIYDQSSWTLGENEFFVMGDNRNPGKSLDSRYFGPVKKDAIKGVVKFRFWPFSDFGIIGG
ncbi:signal peptidase I [Peptoniphilus asaccharolyticus DSM 20463]|uniref:Signal peptidase I n=1 Tax=Peptoniphilus asaccharolyticus DSM 20463 TaxID=573058 RepID=A0A1W1UUH5_PEPAS|nr:signal peptidase I [Peptoniphilus asaccharolyticus]MBL7575202.1 signal peptidase I [Peptoniphilus asaccharolyticus]SMB84785.1 signal peptidase I [Peptoniphilus asaccharolyticus DSM 20463]